MHYCSNEYRAWSVHSASLYAECSVHTYYIYFMCVYQTKRVQMDIIETIRCHTCLWLNHILEVSEEVAMDVSELPDQGQSKLIQEPLKYMLHNNTQALK